MKRESQGRYVASSTAGEVVQAFVPAPLLPQPDIEWTARLRQQFEKAYLALGRLDSISSLLPDTDIFLYMYVRKEAVLSSMIEGTQSSLSDLLLYEWAAFHVDGWYAQWSQNRNLWRLSVFELNELDRQNQFRIIYAFIPSKQHYYIFGVAPRSFNYDDEHPITKRIIRAYFDL